MTKKATQAGLKKIRKYIEEIKRMIEDDSTHYRKAADEPLLPGEARNDRYPTDVTGPNTEENKAVLWRLLQEAKKEEQQILAELEAASSERSTKVKRSRKKKP
jgi:hypothetical protein